MTFLQKVRSTFSSFDTSEFYRNSMLFVGFAVLVTTGSMWFYYTRTRRLQGVLKEVYKQELVAKELLERLKNVQKQSSEVNTLLEKDKNFKIKNFFEDTLRKLQLTGKQRGQARITEEVLKKRYTEVTLQATLQRVNTRQLCELLQLIEH
ncbi:MAG: hypothetical protein ACJAZS_000618, partial [Alteromonas naphthalenivorans]